MVATDDLTTGDEATEEPSADGAQGVANSPADPTADGSHGGAAGVGLHPGAQGALARGAHHSSHAGTE